MKTSWLATVALVGVAAFATGRLQAQAPLVGPAAPGPASPPYSAYLNLLRNGSPMYQNYYGLVRPELDFRKQIYGLQQGVAANAGAISAYDSATGLPLTGHPTQFLNTSHYFLNRGGQGTPGTSPAASGVARPAAATAPVSH